MRQKTLSYTIARCVLGIIPFYFKRILRLVFFISHNTFNSISTDNESFCDETALWMQNLIRKSTPINDVSEKHRFQFFRSLFEKIDEAKQKVVACVMHKMSLIML